ncbi:MAG: GNAT family N-acetyltransferase [Oscillospiraceae bacterium]|nr:GNAT family N-acetyltransferase [Oscillospiraceae bacterium]
MRRDEESNFTIRSLTIKDIDQYNELLRYAFQVTEQELSEKGWKNDEIKRSKFPVLQRADVLGCFDGDDLISQFAVYPLDMNIYGVKYPVGFVTSVCTYPEHTGHGIMKRLMIQSLTRMRESRRPFALLSPYSIPLYRRLGWEIISNKMTYVVKDTQIPRKIKEPGYVRRVEWNDRQFMELHEKFAQKTHGCLFRNNLAWEEYWRWDEDDTKVAVYYSDDDIPYGYMVYLISSDVMHIKEMIYLNHEAQRGLWEYIHAHDSMIDEVRGNNYYSDSIAFELDDSDIKETIRPYSMGRIIDVKQFLENYACDPDEPAACFRFVIEDELLPWNNDSFTVLFENGRCRITDAQPEYTMKMTIATFTTMLLGYKTAEKLYVMDRIISDREAVEKLDDILFHQIPYVSDYI